MDKWLADYNAEYNDNLKIEDLLSWDTHEYAKEREEIYSILQRPGFFRDLKPLPGAIQGLIKLIAAGHEIVIVSAGMYPINLGEKFEWCREHLYFINKKNIVFAHNKHYIPADAIIDDGPHIAEAYRKAHPEAKVIGIEYPYNVSAKEHYTLLVPSYKDTKSAWEQIVSFLGKAEK